MTPRPTRTPTATLLSVRPLDMYVQIRVSSTRLWVGDTLSVEVIATNLGKRDVTSPQYQLTLRPLVGGIVVRPAAPPAVTHSVTLRPEQSDTASFVFLAVCPGELAVDAVVRYGIDSAYLAPPVLESVHASGPIVRVESSGFERRLICLGSPPPSYAGRPSE